MLNYHDYVTLCEALGWTPVPNDGTNSWVDHEEKAVAEHRKRFGSKEPHGGDFAALAPASNVVEFPETPEDAAADALATERLATVDTAKTVSLKEMEAAFDEPLSDVEAAHLAAKRMAPLVEMDLAIRQEVVRLTGTDKILQPAPAKPVVVFGSALHIGTWEGYVQQAIRTESIPNHVWARDPREWLSADHQTTTTRMAHVAIGLLNEAVELKYNINTANLREELGDCFWYLAVATDAFKGWTFNWADAMAYWAEEPATHPAALLDNMLSLGHEIQDHVLQKHVMYLRPLNPETMFRLLQQYAHHLAGVAYQYNQQIEDLWEANILKLEKRYPELVWSTERAAPENRNTTSELEHMWDTATPVAPVPVPENLGASVVSDAAAKYMERQWALLKKGMPFKVKQRDLTTWDPRARLTAVLTADGKYSEQDLYAVLGARLSTAGVHFEWVGEGLANVWVTEQGEDAGVACLIDPKTLLNFPIFKARIAQLVSPAKIASVYADWALQLSNQARASGQNCMAEGYKVVAVKLEAESVGRWEELAHDGYELYTLLYPTLLTIEDFEACLPRK